MASVGVAQVEVDQCLIVAESLEKAGGADVGETVLGQIEGDNLRIL